MHRVAFAAGLAVLLCAGCGGAATRPPAEPHVPRALATAWAEQADHIAAVAAAGNGCEARRLAGSFRTLVIEREGEVPLRLRLPLLRTVARLAGRFVCIPTVPAHPKGPKPPHPHPPHGPHGHGPPGPGDGGDGQGDGGNQG